MDSYNSANTTCSYCEARSFNLDYCKICKTFLCKDHFKADEITGEVCEQCVDEAPVKYIKHLSDVVRTQLRFSKEIKEQLEVFKDAQDDAEDDYHNQDTMHYDDLPFLEVSGKPQGKVEQAYCDLAVMCVRADINLCEPAELLKKHNSNACMLRLSPDQIDVLQVIILVLDNAEVTT